MTARRILRPAAIVLALAAVFHLGLVWALPRAITMLFMHRVAATAGYDHVVMPPLPDASARQVPKPSPDLLYAVCVFDQRSGPVRISARPPAGSYWSLALYDANSDNFFALNDRAAKGQPVTLILTPPAGHAAIAARYPEATIVEPPGNTGVMLTRSLVADPDDMAAINEARSHTICEGLDDASGH